MSDLPLWVSVPIAQPWKRHDIVASQSLFQYKIFMSNKEFTDFMDSLSSNDEYNLDPVRDNVAPYYFRCGGIEDVYPTCLDWLKAIKQLPNGQNPYVLRRVNPLLTRVAMNAFHAEPVPLP